MPSVSSPNQQSSTKPQPWSASPKILKVAYMGGHFTYKVAVRGPAVTGVFRNRNWVTARVAEMTALAATTARATKGDFGQMNIENAQALKEATKQGGAFAKAMAQKCDHTIDGQMQKLQQRWDLVLEKIDYALVPAFERLIL